MQQIQTNSTISDVFGTGFEFQTLQLILRDSTFLKEFSSFLKDKYYSSAYTKNILTICLSFFSTYKRPPVYDEILSQLNKQFWDDGQKELLDNHIKLLDKIYLDQLPDPAFIRNNLQSFIEKAELSILLYNSVQNFDKLSVDKLKEQVTSISKIKTTNDSTSIDLKDFFTTVLLDDSLETGIPTMYTQLDHTLRGGLRAGELMVIMAPTNRGKSQMLVNLGRGMLIGGANVLHITIGDMSANDVVERYVASMTNTTTAELRDFNSLNQVKKMLQSFNIFTDKSMKVKFFNGFEATISNIHNYIEHLKHVEGFKTDVVIIDYADLIKPDNIKLDKRHQLTEIYVRLRGMGVELGIPIVTASQTNRAGEMADFRPNKQIVSNKPVALSTVHVAEDWGKAATADYMFGLRRPAKYSKLDPNERILIMDTIKSRNSSRDAKFFFKIDFTRCRIDECDINLDEFIVELNSRPNVEDILE